MNKQEKIEICEEAFSCHAGHSCFSCNCGKVFYNSNGGWDWEEGHLEELEKSNAIDLDYAVEDLTFEGQYFCKDCSCWHDRALRIFNFLMAHNRQIVDLFKAAKKLEQKKVDAIRVI